jgi:Ribosomal protein L13
MNSPPRSSAAQTIDHISLATSAAESAAAVAEPPRQQSVVASAGVRVARKGKDLWNDSYYPTGEDAQAVTKAWYIIDAKGQTLGRLAALAAHHIRCRHTLDSTRH